MAEATKSVEKDEELEELLDSALEDFSKPPPSQAPTESKSEGNAESLNDDTPPWSNEFLLEAQKTFENNLRALFRPGVDGELSPEQVEDQLHRIAEEANRVLNEQANHAEFSETITQTLKNLSESSEKIQAEMGPDALSSMLGGLGLGTEEESSGDFMPFMQSMMQSFLSKEVLYPSVKEITEKYPVWLEEHKTTLSESDYTNYNKQYEVMKKLCLEFEDEKDSDSEEIKKERFSKIFSLMEEMQKLGQPPKDLVFDENGSPIPLPDLDSSQCSIM